MTDQSPHLTTPFLSPESAMEEDSNSHSQTSKSYWSWSKQDLYPEPSFQNLQAYKSALYQTKSRLKNRFFNRSTDAFELQAKNESVNDLKRCLNWWDLIWLAFGSVVGTGIFVLTGLEAHNDAGPAIVLSYAISGVSVLLSVFCYTEFAVEVPVAGGSFSYLRIELGDFVAFIAAGNILLEAVVGAAGLARSWSGYFATLFDYQSDHFRFHVEKFPNGVNMLDPIAFAVLILLSAIPMFGTLKASLLNWIVSLLSVAVIVFVVVTGVFVKGELSNVTTTFIPYGVGGVFRASAVLFWAYTGFDMVATLAEETKKPSRDIPIGLIGSMSMITVVYMAMALALSMMVKYTEMDVNAAFSVAFKQIGMKWASYVVALAALKGMTTGLMVGALGQGRYTTQIARTHMIPPCFARVHPKTKTPINAMLLVTIPSACIAFFTDLDVLSSVSSLSTLFIFMLMAVALIVRRYYSSENSSKSDLIKLWVFLLLILGASIGTSAYYHARPSGWFAYVITGPIWFIGVLGIQLFLPQQHAPKVWGVPLVPWLPAVSIAINLFLIGALGHKAFVRFAICTGVMLVYYLFVTLHTTYDVAQQKAVVDLEISK